MQSLYKNKYFLSIGFILLVLLPVFAFAQSGNFLPLVPECPAGQECGYAQLLELVRRLINWLIVISVPVSAGVFAWAGFILMTSGDNAGKRSEAKSMMTKVFIGFVFILSAWLIVSTVVGAILDDTSMLPINF